MSNLGEYVGLNVLSELGPASVTFLAGASSTTSNATQDYSINFTGASGKSGVSILLAWNNNRDISSVVIDPGGAAMSANALVTVSDDTKCAIYTAPWTTDGTFTVRVSYSGAVDRSRCVVQALDQMELLTARDTDQQNITFSTSTGVTVDVPEKGIVLFIAIKNNTDTMTVSGATEDSEVSLSTDYRVVTAALAYLAGSAGQAVTASWSNSRFARSCAATLR
jgi:hypothetical protein